MTPGGRLASLGVLFSGAGKIFDFGTYLICALRHSIFHVDFLFRRPVIITDLRLRFHAKKLAREEPLWESLIAGISIRL